MRKTLRLTAVAFSVVVGLVFVGPALATPKLIIGGLTAVGSSQTSIQFTQTTTDAAPARIVIYSPAGYSGTVTATPNTVLGTVHADLQALAISPDAVVQADGQILAADPAAYTNNACAPGAHTAVWLLHVTVSGQTLDVPVFVDTPVPAGDPLAESAPLRLVMCFSSPYVGTTVGGAPFGAKLLNATLKLNQGTIRTPTTRGSYIWRAVVTPYAVGGALPAAANTVEARGIVRTPTILSINARVLSKKQRRVQISGLLRDGDANLPLVPVTLSRGGKPKGKAPYNLGPKTRKRTTTNGNVTFTLRFKKKGTVYFQLSTTTGARDLTSVGCSPATTPTLRCVSATVAPIAVYSRVVKLKL